jgi:Uma2 family endonuclease
MINVLDLPDSVVRISGDIIATGVSYDDFMAGYDEMHVEWVNGTVILMPSITDEHDGLTKFLIFLFGAALPLMGGGRLLTDPMVMKLEEVPSSRAPDIQILLPDRLHQLQGNQVMGPANLVIEVISPGSRRTDLLEKLREYELGRVPEYWILDYQRKRAVFNQLNDKGVYDIVEPDEQGLYHSRVLPKLKLDISLLWRDPLPDFWEVVEIVKAMLK